MSPDPSTRPSRFQLPNLIAGIIIGVLVAGGIVPLVVSDDDTGVRTSGSDLFSSSSSPAEAAGPSSASGHAGSDGLSAGETGGDGTSGPGGAGSGSTGAVGGTTASTGAAASEPRGASDVGVTKDVIRVGVMTLNCRACAALGVTSLDNTSHADLARAFANELNSRGGINGRKVEVYAADYDPAQDAVNGGGTERAACLELTENRKVFAVIMGGTFANACVYDEHKAPMITPGEPPADDPATFNAVEGRLWTFNPSSARILVNWARQLDRMRLITRDSKFGIVVTDGPQRTQVERYLLPELKRLGYAAAHVSVIPNDFQSVPVKTASEVPTMKATGVDRILMAAEYAVSQAWIRESQRNGWKPQYLQSDFPSGANDYSGGQNSQAGDWSGAIAISSTPEYTQEEIRRDPTAKPCFDIWERASGTRTSQNLSGWVMNYCNSFRTFEAAMRRAGINPTRRTFVQSMASLGPVPVAGAFASSFGGRYGLGSVRWSAATQAQRKVWRKPCPRPESDSDGCYVPEGAPFDLAT